MQEQGPPPESLQSATCETTESEWYHTRPLHNATSGRRPLCSRTLPPRAQKALSVGTSLASGDGARVPVAANDQHGIGTSHLALNVELRAMEKKCHERYSLSAQPYRFGRAGDRTPCRSAGHQCAFCTAIPVLAKILSRRSALFSCHHPSKHAKTDTRAYRAPLALTTPARLSSRM